MTENRAKRWLYLGLMLVVTLPFLSLLLLLALYLAPDFVLGWPWSEGAATILGPLVLIVGPIVLVKPLAAFASKSKRHLVVTLVASVVMAAAFVPAAYLLHNGLGTPDSPRSCDNVFKSADRCLGRNSLMMQTGWRILRGKGVPHKDLCERFLAAPPGQSPTSDCEHAKPELWPMADCAQYGAPGDWHCRSCEHEMQARNVYREFLGFERTCARGMMAESVNREITL